MTKYQKVFWLTIGIILSIGIYAFGKSELNKEQTSQIESLIITSQCEEKGVANKTNGLMVNAPYYIGKLYDETTPMVASDQFVMPVLKYGIPGKEPEYADDNESLRLEVVRKSKGCYS